MAHPHLLSDGRAGGNMAGRCNGRGGGFSLLELLVVMALGLLLLGWGVPALSDFMKGVRVGAASAHFIGLLETLRHRSLVLPGPVTICGTLDGVRCSRLQGRRLVAFEDGNGNGVVDVGERVQLQEEFLDSEEFWLVWRSFQNKDYLRWAAGRTDSMNGTFTLCNRRRKDEWLRQVVVNRAARTRMVRPARQGGAVLLAARQSCGW